MNWIRHKTDSRYVLIEGIELPDILGMWGYLGKKTLNERVGESKLEE